jgi:DUF1680 family protein
MSSAIHTAEWTEGTGGEFAIMIRVPKWASSVDKNTITVNGVSVKVGQPGSYTRVQGTWKAGDKVEAQCSLAFELGFQLHRAMRFHAFAPLEALASVRSI